MRELTVGSVALMVCAGVLLNSTHVNAEPVQWSGNGHWYEAVSVPGGISWTDANSAAIGMGGYLASITSADENTFVYSLVDDDTYWKQEVYDHYNGPWLGGIQTTGSPEPADNWQWVDAEPFVYTNWNSGLPNNGAFGENGEDSIHFMGWGSEREPMWNDAPHEDTQIVGYVVESVPEPSTLFLLSTGAIGLLAYVWRRRKRTA